ncbi:RIC1-domain-containing protein [Paraphysoderma sedebokerense]|nr:RIC1-domain-containing protein [Paraphysoderma sedebokerense]
MYFTISSSKTLSHHDHDLAQVIAANPVRNPSFPEDVIIAIRENWDASLFVAIGVRALWLWSAKPAAVIAKIFRSESSITEHGENKEVIWKPDSSMIIVITSLGFLHFYTVDPQTSTKAFEYQFVRAHHYLAGAGQGKGIPNLPVKFKVSVKVEGGVQCGVCLTEELIVTTSKAPSIHTISLTNDEVNVTESKYLSEIIFLGIDKDSSEDNGTYLRQLIYSEDLNLFVWITSKGQAYLVKRFDAGGWGDNLAPEHDSAETPKRYYWAGIPIDIPVDPTAKSAAGLTRRSQAGMLPDADTAKRNFVICATFNSRFNLVTVGARDGNVYTYSIDTFSIDRFVPQSTSAFPDKSDLWFKFSHILKLTEQGSGYETHQLGTVSSLAYTWDGYALAVCWPGYGMAVFSVFGRKLITLNKNTVKEELSSPRDSKPGIKLEGYFDGVLHLFWGPGCYELYLLPTSARISTINDQLYVLPFARSGLTTANTLDNVRNPFLITEDRLFLYIGNHRELDTMKENVLLWHVIPLPPVYISENWPIKYSVVSQDGRYLAVAGKRGFAHYSVESGRWKLFGNSQQEKDVLCRGLVWYKNILIAAIQDASSLKCQLLFFSRDQKLDLSLAIHEEWLPHVTLLMNVCGPYLFIYTFDNVLTVFKLNLLHNGHHIQCELYIEIDMSDIVKQPKNVLSLAFFPDLLPGKTSNEFACIDNRPIMILMEGRLLLLDISSSGERNQPSIEQKSNSYLMSLAERVEFFWLSINPVGNLKNSIWAFTEKYCMIFANVFLPGDSNFKSSEWRYHLPLENLTYAIDAVKFPLDFYPLTTSLTKGIISGVELWLSVKQSLECVTFSMTTKTHLFLSHIYENLLRRRLYDEAVEFATQYESLHYFAHSLEMLLHRVWEEEAETLVGFGSEAVLPQVIKFLEHFPNFLDVIVQCTRKTEISLWDYLFSIVGSPQDLFERCLNLGRLRTATSYLVIIHNMESSTVSGKDSVRLLEKVLEVEDFELLRELVRFLSSISNNSNSLWDRMPSIQNFTPYINSEASQSSASISTMETQEPYMYLEIMVSRHARKLLQKGRIRALGKLSRVLDFPLTKWLRRERLVSKTTEVHSNWY